MFYIVVNDFPCWYHLSFEQNTLFIYIHLHVKAKMFELLTPNSPLPGDLQNSLGIPEFSFDETCWGFGGNLQWEDSADKKWCKVKAAYPLVQRDDFGLTSQSWTELYSLSASLQILFLPLEMNDVQTDALHVQPFTLSLTTFRGLSGGSLEASLSPSCCKWLSENFADQRLRQVEEKMVQAYAHLWGKKVRARDRDDFLTYCRHPHWLHLNVPGNACGLDPAEHSDFDFKYSNIRGCRLTPHNTDSPLQQLSLLAGLAELSNMFTTNFKSTPQKT